MKKYLRTLLFMVCLFMLTACGAENSTFGNQETESEFYDIQVEETEIFNTELTGTYLGVQFYGDDMAQIRLGRGGIWMLKVSGGSENILPEYGYFTGNWFLTSEGKSVLFYDEISGGGVQVLDQDGERLFFLDDILGLSICETADGKVYLLAEEEGSVFLAQLNMDSGSLRRVEGLAFNQISNLTARPYRCLGLGPEGLMLLDSEGIWKIEEAENKAVRSLVLSFDSTSYMDMISNPSSNPNYDLRDISAFQVLEDGSAELLWKYKDSGRSLLQVLSYEKIEKQILRLRCTSISGWMAECITEFNRSNENYQVVLEQPVSSDWTDFRQRTDMEIGAGRGADLIIGQASYNFSALQEKGALEDITPYLEQSGIHRADYFPAVFAQKEGQKTIYGISPEISLKGLWISREVLGDTHEINIETLVNALNDYSGKGSIYVYPSIYILRFLLEGSENFWGMVNYEKKNCDFDSELFIKILNIAKRYGDKSYMDSPYIIGERLVQTLGYFENREELNLQGKIALGYIFDDGVYSPLSWRNMLAMNANSTNKDGCWEFICFLLREDSQRKMTGLAATGLPSNRKVFAELQSHELEWSGKSEDITISFAIEHGVCTEEDAAEQLELMENLHIYPLGNEPLLEIILDEAQDYIDGLKPIEVIIENINNRVQLYLDEQS